MIPLFLLGLALPDDSEDDTLSGRMRAGDKKAFRLFFEKYHRLLFSYLLSKGVPKQDAEDLVQTAFLKVWENRANLEPGRSLRGFIYTIAINRMRNFFRDRKEHDSEYAYRLSDKSEDPSRAFENREAMQAMQNALQKMPERRRRVFELCYLQEFSHKEVAEIMQIEKKTVENHMAKALKELRQALQKFHINS